MLTFEEAKSMAHDVIRELAVEAGEELAFQDDQALEQPYGWVFFFNTKRFIQSHKPRDALAGNGPLLVDKVKAKVIRFGTAYPVDRYLKHYEKTGNVLGSQ